MCSSSPPMARAPKSAACAWAAATPIRRNHRRAEAGDRIITSSYTGFADKTVSNFQENDRMIRLVGLRKAYRTESVETTALDDIDLQIDAGEFVAIMGPSGCGKSTLLNIIGLLDRPTGGTYALEGREVALLPENGADRYPQAPDRLHLPEFQPDRRIERARKCRARTALSRHQRGRAPGPGRQGARQGRHRPPRRAPPQPAFGRPAAARRRRPRRGRRTAADPGR